MKDIPRGINYCAVTVLSYLILSLFAFAGCGRSEPTHWSKAQRHVADTKPSIISLTETKTVITHSDILAISKDSSQANIDGPISTYTDGNIRYWVMPNVVWDHNDFVVYHITTKSDLQAGLESPIGTSHTILPQWDFFSYPTSDPGGRWWIVSIYKINEGEALGFVHVEIPDVGRRIFPGHGRIGVAYFKKGTNNDRWRYMGHVLANRGDPANTNMAGAPYIVKDGYIYFYYSDDGGPTAAAKIKDYGGSIAVARTNLADLIYSAQNGLASPAWYKYFNGNWNSLGLGGDFTDLNFDERTIVHAGAAYSEYNQKYYIAATKQKREQTPTEIVIYESDDAVTWIKKAEFAQDSDPNVKVGWQYTAIVNTDYTKWPIGIVGQSFYVYSGWEYDRHNSSDPCDNKYNSVWKRFRININ